jgi:hypothetical protein
VAIGYNLCLGMFGGTTPLIATYLVARTADDFAPAYYLMGVTLVSFLVLLGLPETAHASLSTDWCFPKISSGPESPEPIREVSADSDLIR